MPSLDDSGLAAGNLKAVLVVNGHPLLRARSNSELLEANFNHHNSVQAIELQTFAFVPPPFFR
jgi:hypothetical protein